MSRAQSEKQYNVPTKDTRKPQGKRANRYVVFRPSEGEKAQIKADKTPFDKVVERLAAKVAFDAKLAVGFKPENSAFFVHLTDTSVHWEEAVTLAAWHANVDTAIRMLEFALRDRYAEFPDISALTVDEELAW